MQRIAHSRDFCSLQPMQRPQGNFIYVSDRLRLVLGTKTIGYFPDFLFILAERYANRGL